MAAKKKAKKSARKSGKPTKSAKKKAAPKKKASKKASAKKPVAKKSAKVIQPRRKSPETLRLRGVTPSLTVADLPKSIAWYRDVLGCVTGEEWKRDGVLQGIELLAGAARFYIGQDDWAKGRDRKKGEGVRLHLSTAQSIDDIAANVKKQGGKLDSEPATAPWGSRYFTLSDPDGFKLTVSSQ
jgi:uncharacterized glyoxalase superfamily protein PhnB